MLLVSLAAILSSGIRTGLRREQAALLVPCPRDCGISGGQVVANPVFVRICLPALQLLTYWPQKHIGGGGGGKMAVARGLTERVGDEEGWTGHGRIG